MKKISIKIKESYRKIVAACDEELLGKYFEQGNKQLNIKKDFYEGEKKSKEEVISLLKELDKDDSTFNLVGKESINAGIQAGIINKKGVMAIQGIPYALSLL